MAFGIMASTPDLSQPDEKDIAIDPDDSVSMTSDSSTIHLRTPTSSSISSFHRSNNIPYIIRDCAPGPGSIYIIVHKSGGENKALIIVGKHLRLATPLELLPNPPVLNSAQAKTFAGICNWHWHCQESDGWLGFRNAATGRWLNSAVPTKTSESVAIQASSTEFAVLEQFCVRKKKDEEEGYALLKRVDLPRRPVCLMPVGFNFSTLTTPAFENGHQSFLAANSIHTQKTSWEFVKVDHGFVSL